MNKSKNIFLTKTDKPMAKLSIEVDLTSVESPEQLALFHKALGGFIQALGNSGSVAKEAAVKANPKSVEPLQVKLDPEVEKFVEKQTKAEISKAEEPAAPKQETQSAEIAQKPGPSIKDLRDLVAKKVEVHRDIIKFKLTQFGANNVSSLDPGKYEEFHSFLLGLG